MSEKRSVSEQEAKIASWLRDVKFRRQIFGGVSERDVWTKISQLNEMYNQAILAERARCEALLAERDRREPEGGSTSQTT